MHERHSSTQYEIAGILSDTLRSIKRRRELRRMHMNEAYAATMSTVGAAASPPQGAPRPPAVAADMTKMFGPTGWVDIGGRAVPVMDDPAKLQALYDQVAATSGLSPSDLIFAFSGASPAHARPGADSAAAGVAANAAPPPEAPKTPAPASPPSPVETATAATQASPDTTPKENQAATDKAPQESAPAAAAPRDSSILADMEGILARRADEDAVRLAALLREHEARMTQQAEAAASQQAALLREHETRMAQQAEAVAKQQASLLREVMDSQAKQLDAQAARHTQVIRDLLREHQVELDERAAMAGAKEAQVVGALLREHRDAFEEAHGAHRRDLEEILEHHRGEMQAARKAPGADGGSTQLRDLVAEQARNQHTALSSLTETVKTLGEAVTRLTDHCTHQQTDLFSLPPPSFVPALPDTVTAFTPPVVSPPAAAAMPSTNKADVPALPEPPAVDPPPALSPARPAATCSAMPTGAHDTPTEERPNHRQLSPANARRMEDDRERDHISALIDEARDDDDDDDDPDDDEMRPRLAPLTPLEAEGQAHA